MGYELKVVKKGGEPELDEFCCNQHGMQYLRQTMLDYGMLAKDYESPAAAPSAVEEEERELLRAWRPAAQGIAAHKLMSNEQWLVTQKECREAIGAYMSAQNKLGKEDDLFHEFVRFLEHAAKLGGFRVW